MSSDNQELKKCHEYAETRQLAFHLLKYQQMSDTDTQFNEIKDAIRRQGLIKVPVQEEEKGKESTYRRVAKFLLLIGVEEAAKIIPHLPQDQVEKIIPEIASIRNVSQDEAVVILAEFQSLLNKSREQGGVDTARDILVKAYGEKRADDMLKKAVPFADGKPFDYLQDIESDKLYILLKDESTPVRALVLSQIPPKTAAETINAMNADEKAQVVSFLAKMKAIDPETLRRVDKSMHEKVLAINTQKADRIDGRGALADILKRMDVSMENSILSSLAHDDPALSDDLKERLFTTEDFLNVDDRYLQDYLRGKQDVEIAYIVAGKKENFRMKIFSNISTTRGDQVLEEEQLHKPMLKSDVDAATNKFFTDMRRAWEKGDLFIKGRDDEIYV